MKKFYAVVAAVLLGFCLFGAAGCSGPAGGFDGIGFSPVQPNFPAGIDLCELAPPASINSRQDLSDFMDYCIFYPSTETRYAAVGEEYGRKLRDGFWEESLWAGQNGALSHNFWSVADTGRLSENLVGVRAASFPYGYRGHENAPEDVKVVNYIYYRDVISKPRDRGYSLTDFPLYQKNKGFVPVGSSEQLFYAVQCGYMPVPEEGSAAEKILSDALGILNRLLREDMTDLQKVQNIYQYILCENTYDYEAVRHSEYEHFEFAAYFLEGVFEYHNAVCDGLTKTLVLLCGLEGIEAYHIGAVSNGSGHAYAYVNVGGQFYLCCPTRGSEVKPLDGLRYHCHTDAFFLTDYETSSPSWGYASDVRPAIGEQVKKVEKYDFWARTKIETRSGEYNFSPDSADEAEAVLRTVGDAAKNSGITMQVELNCSYDMANEAMSRIQNEYEVEKFNNGSFGGKLLYAFLFRAGKGGTA